MFVDADLTTSPPGLALLEPDEFRSLKVLVRGGATNDQALAEALGPVGTLDAEGNALLQIEQLKRLAGDRAADDRWLASFDAMVSYARSKGWVSDDGHALQAHCERQGEHA